MAGLRTGYFKLVKNAVEVHSPRLNELAYATPCFRGSLVLE
jgi:hypothetical protein